MGTVLDAMSAAAANRADERRPTRHKVVTKIPGEDHPCITGTEQTKAKNKIEIIQQQEQREKDRKKAEKEAGKGKGRGKGRGKSRSKFCAKLISLYFSWEFPQSVSTLSLLAELGTSAPSYIPYSSCDVPTSASSDNIETCWGISQEKYKFSKKIAHNLNLLMFGSHCR